MQLGNFVLEDTVLLGQGSDGKVFSGCDSNGESVAIKKIMKSTLSERAQRHLDFEIKTLRALQHPNVAPLKEVIYDGDAVYFISEQSDQDLYEFFQNEGPLTEAEVRSLMTQIVSAVAYCHSKNIVHHDLCLENLMVKMTRDEVTEERKLKVQLIDFGFCEEVSPGNLLERFSGSEAYVAPEILEAQPYEGKPIDIWSLGVILFVLLRGSFPFDPDDADRHFEQANDLHYIASLLSGFEVSQEEVRDLLFKIFDPDPETRMTAEGIWSHPWLSHTH